MVPSLQAMLAPVREGWPDSVHPEDAVRLTEFSLTPAIPYRQVAIQYENPLCGMTQPAQQNRHVCHFGLTMWQVSAPAGSCVTHWVGRRFTSVHAMHEALDRLIVEGLDEETILAHLPPNPIANEEEIRQAALKLASVGIEPVRGCFASAKPARQASPQAARGSNEPAVEAEGFPGYHVGNWLEYLEQVHSLLSTAKRAETIAERFLRTIAAVVPFDDMSVYLQEQKQWVIAASVDCAGSRPTRPRAQSCYLEPMGLGATAIVQNKIMIEQDDRRGPFAGEFQGPGTLAIPFPLGSGQPIGVWLARQIDPQRSSLLGADLVRFMRLEAELLAARLQRTIGSEPAETEPAETEILGNPEDGVEWLPVTESAAGMAQGEPERLPAEELSDLREALGQAVARANRKHDAVAVLCLKVACTAGPVELPVEELTRKISTMLRPYGRLTLFPGPAKDWYLILPTAQESAVRTIAQRMLTTFEDVMDASGGTEERGLQPGIGISFWGVNAAGPDEMVRHAAAAADRAWAQAGETPIQICGAPLMAKAAS
jgi:hypothetical protein